MHQIRLAAGLCPDPVGELVHSLRPVAAMGAYFYGERGKGRERREPTY